MNTQTVETHWRQGLAIYTYVNYERLLSITQRKTKIKTLVDVWQALT